MKRLCQALLLLVLPVALHAQVTLHGTVVDQQTGSPIAHAQVTATGGTTSATTDDGGRFTVSSSGAIASVKVVAVGYVSRTVAVTKPAEALRVELTLSQTELPGIQVVAKQAEPSTGVLTRSDLDRFNGVGLTDAINTLPGVFMQSRTPFGGAHIDIRGYYPSFGGNSPNSNGAGYNAFINNIPITDAAGHDGAR